MKRTWETMEEAPADIEMAIRREVLPTVEEAGEAVAEAVPFLEDAGIIAGEVAVTAAEGVEAFTNPVAAAVLLGSSLWQTFYDKNGKRKRERVITTRAPDASRPDPTRRGPYLPGPRRAGPDRRNFGPTDNPSSSMPAKKSTGGKKRKAGKAMKRKTVSKRPVKKARTSSKKKPKKKSVSYAVTTKQEVHGIMKRKNVSYFGFQATAGMNELFKAAADALLRAVLKKHHISVRRTDEAPRVLTSVPNMNKIQFFYRRTKYQDGTDDTNNINGGIMNLSGGGTYGSYVSTLATQLETQARNGAFVYQLKALNNDGGVVTESWKIGDAKLNLSVKRAIKLRNITKADGGSGHDTVLDTNPIQGRLYKFRHDVPRVAPVIYTTARDDFAKFHDRNCTAGVIFGPQRKASGDNKGTYVEPSIMAVGKILSSPPPGGRVWDNLSSSKKIGLAPGQAATHKMAFKFSGTVRQFMSKFGPSDYVAPSIGYCHMFGFEQKFKTDANDIINVEYDCDDVLKAGCTFVREDTTPPTVRTVHAQSSTFD